MTDAEWAVFRPLLPVPGWLRGRGGQPEAYCHRAMLDAIHYLVDNGIKWRAMPGDFPPWDRFYALFRRWRDQALVREFHDRLRARIRERLGRDAEPSAGLIDSQSVKADAVVGSDSRGFDGGKLINGHSKADHGHRQPSAGIEVSSIQRDRTITLRGHADRVSLRLSRLAALAARPGSHRRPATPVGRAPCLPCGRVAPEDSTDTRSTAPGEEADARENTTLDARASAFPTS
ncbi:transposase [Streptomyces sp. NBC_00885]|uniref:transposase n=1 Tax=Streptomyces sp. NBC_00885 TaxID=2975857 RepID=UPI00386C362A|nr:transposase [Streptomyces sp. NBC_00885]